MRPQAACSSRERFYAWADRHEITVRYDGTGATKTELVFTSPAPIDVVAAASGMA